MKLTPTSYALLGLLAVDDWTTYELAQQTKRSLRFFFPRAERQLYAEAKRLTEAGLATTTIAYTGRRASTTYAITAEGRSELAAWLGTEPAPPVLEAEVVLRAFFADHGRVDDLLAALAVARDQAVDAQRELATLAGVWLAGDAPFPDRMSQGAITMRFVADFHELVERWATWAASEVSSWDDAQGRGWAGARATFAAIAERVEAQPGSRPE
jgi:DNA-binding PadR family transcriptional regulator